MLTIKETMKTFLNLLKSGEGEPFSRFKSWEYCHKVFLDAHERIHNQKETLNDDQIDYLALHLSFYLASWGMYRGSSFILQRDYKSHKRIVEAVLKEDYNDLWDYDPSANNAKDPKKIAELAGKAYDEIVKEYKYPDNKIPERYFTDDGGDADKPVSVTLITKVLMGTFAISPAFDRFFQDGVKVYKNNNSKHGLSGGFNTRENFEEGLLSLFEFANNKCKELKIPAGVTAFPYPIMKRVDMYFWEVGYELGFYKALKEKKNKLTDTMRCFTNAKSKKPYSKTIEQIKTLFQDSEKLVDDPNDHLGTIESFMNYIGERL